LGGESAAKKIVVLLVFDEPNRASNRKRFLVFGLLILTGFGFVGQTLASNVNLGSGAPLEFGQGIQTLVSCSPEAPIILTPRNVFENAPGNSGLFRFSGISFAGIQNSCVGYDFVIRAYGLTGGPLTLFGGNKSEMRIYQSNGDQFSRSVNDSFTITNQTFGAFTVTFDIPVAPSADVYRITVETLDHDSSMIRYRIGDTGPAGGIIFLTPNSQSNSTGQYFEVTQNRVGNEIWCDQWPIDIPQTLNSSIGSGRSNTSAITSNCNAGAAVVVSGYSGGGYSDWFLPSRDELVSITSVTVPTLPIANYWSSTQFDQDGAVAGFSGTSNVYDKIMTLSVLAVRSFS
jgi:hypothetical protein